MKVVADTDAAEIQSLVRMERLREQGARQIGIRVMVLRRYREGGAHGGRGE